MNAFRKNNVGFLLPYLYAIPQKKPKDKKDYFFCVKFAF